MKSTNTSAASDLYSPELLLTSLLAAKKMKNPFSLSDCLKAVKPNR